MANAFPSQNQGVLSDGLAMPESAAMRLVEQRRREAVLTDPCEAEWQAGRTSAEPPMPRFFDLHRHRLERRRRYVQPGLPQGKRGGG